MRWIVIFYKTTLIDKGNIKEFTNMFTMFGILDIIYILNLLDKSLTNSTK